MRVSRRAAVAGVLAIAFTGALGGSAFASSGGSLYVNGSTGHDVGTCRLSGNPCLTIGYALTKVTANSTIHVAAGTYAEQVTIPSNLTVTITGPTTGTATIEPNSLPNADVDTDSSAPELAIVDVKPSAHLKLSHMTIDGSAASSGFEATGCADDFVGVYFHDASGSLSADTIQNVVLPTDLFGCQDGQGVYVATDPSTTANVTMTNVTVSNYDKNGITCDDPGTSCTIKHANVTGIGPTAAIAQNGIQIWDANGSVTRSTVTANSYTNPDYPGNFYGASGILVIDAGTLSLTYNNVHANDTNIYANEDNYGLPQATLPQGAWTISYNNSSGAVNSNSAVPFGAGIGDGIDLLDVSNVTVSNNVSSHSYEYGVGLFGSGTNTVSDNTANSNGGGFYIGTGYTITDSTGNTLDGNTAKTSSSAGDPTGSGDGIFADTTATGNTIENSILVNNTDYDAFDASTGSGTSGTANSWYSNSCTPANDSDPAGLCNATPPPMNAALAAIAHLVTMQHRQVEVRPAS